MPRDAVIGVVVLAFAGLYWLGAGTIRRSTLEDAAVGAAGLPNTLAAVLAVLAVLLIVRSFVASPRPAAAMASSSAPRPLPHPHQRALAMLALGVGYLVVLPYLGYALAVMLLLGAVAVYNGRQPTPGLALFAVAGAAGFYVLFVRVLNIRLPGGIWPDLF